MPHATARRFKFTVKAIAAEPAPHIGRVYHYDTLIRGLALCITASDKRTFYLYRWVNGRPERIRLATIGDITIDQARRMAAEKNGLIAQGVNPQRQKIEARTEATFGELFTAYLEQYKKPRRPKSAPQDEANYNLHLSHWKNRKLSEITHAAVSSLHTKIGAKHPYLANRLMALISSMFNRARSLGVSIVRAAGEAPNPAEGIERFKEEKREKYLNPDAVSLFFQNLSALRYKTTADFFRFALFTGQRRGNIQTMRWEHVSEGVWRMPDTKANRSHTVPLTQEALAVLAERKAADGESPWVFPSPRSASGHIVEPKGAWQALMKKSGLEGYRVHDLRHTLASWMAAGGTSLLLIGKGLGHSQPATTARYAHVATDPVKAVMAAATAAMMQTRYTYLGMAKTTPGWGCLLKGR